MRPDSVGVATLSCSLRVRIYKVRTETQRGAFLTLAAKLKKVHKRKENDAKLANFTIHIPLVA